VKRENLDDHLVRFYSERSPSPDTTDRLLALTASDMTTQQSTPRRWSTQSMLAVAAVVVVGVVSASLLVKPPTDDHTGSSTVRLPSTATESTATPGTASGAVTTQTRLVAVKFHYDGCPMSAAAETHFAAMRDKYANESVIFTTLNITDEARKRESMTLAKTLGIECVYEDGQCESGTLKLVDFQRHEVLAIATDGNEVERWKSALAHAVTP
jgi:hypothetical protein